MQECPAISGYCRSKGNAETILVESDAADDDDGSNSRSAVNFIIIITIIIISREDQDDVDLRLRILSLLQQLRLPSRWTRFLGVTSIIVAAILLYSNLITLVSFA
jgi:hypothetical protein